MNSKEYIFQIFKELGFSGNKTELRKEYENLFVVVKLQKSRFGEDVYLNFGILYKDLMIENTPKLKNCQLKFRYRQLLMALKKDEFRLGIDDAFHQKLNRSQFEENYNNHFERMILEFNDLKKMKSEFPNNLPVLNTEENEDDFTHVIYYFNAEAQLNKYFSEY